MAFVPNEKSPVHDADLVANIVELKAIVAQTRDSLRSASSFRYLRKISTPSPLKPESHL